MQKLNAVCIESLERKRSRLKSLPLTEVFDIDFPFSLPHFFTCRSISLLVNIQGSYRLGKSWKTWKNSYILEKSGKT